MHRGHRSIIGFTAIAAGLFIIFSLVLPGEFWWFMVAATLICGGIWYIRC